MLEWVAYIISCCLSKSVYGIARFEHCTKRQIVVLTCERKGCVQSRIFTMKNQVLSGLGIAMITPFNAAGTIDWAATERLVNHLLNGKTDFLVVLGTTGETPTLTPDEQHEYVRRVIAQVAGRVPIVVGKSSNNTQRLVKEFEVFDYEGVDYILSAVPNYNKPNQEGIYQHFAAVARASKRPIILYNVPGRTGVNMLASTTLRLAREFPNIVGIKEAAGSLDQVSEILAGQPKDFVVLSGDDSLTLPMIAVGAQGVISVVGNALPALFGEMIHAALRQEFHTAAAIHLRLHNFYKLLFEQGNPVGVKAAMANLGICENRLRLPLVPATEELSKRIAEALKTL